MRKGFVIQGRLCALFVVLALSVMAAGPGRAAAPPAPISPRVDPAVLADTAGGATGRFLVLLAARADAPAAAGRAMTAAAGAGRGAAWAAQGRAVYDALQATAAASQPAVVAQLAALGATYRRFSIVNVLAVAGGRPVVDALAARPDVAAIVPDHPFRASLEGTPAPTAAAGAGTPDWNVAQVNAPALWALGDRGQGTVYANADTGVQWDHPALKARYRGWNGVTVDHNYNWWDAVHEPIPSGAGANPCGRNLDHPCDDYGHGTHVMGTGVGDGGPGAAIGVAPGAVWIACRNMDQGWGRPSAYLECLQFFLAPWKLDGSGADPGRRPDVIANSYACPLVEGCDDAHVLAQAIANLSAAGVFLAAAAGNSGAACSSVSAPPGLEAGVISAGATDAGNQVAGFSSRGPVVVDRSYRRKPDLVAPGVDVRSSIPGGGYGLLSGTSMAAPHVAAAVALLWSAYPGLRHDVDLTAYLLERSARPLPSGQGCGGDLPAQVPNNTSGYGLLDVLAAYNAAAAPPPAGAILAISGAVWLDADRNLVRETGEPPLAGVPVHAERYGQVVQTVTTAADGRYAFAPLPAGFYDVWAATPPGFVATPSATHVEAYFGQAGADFGAWPGTALYLPWLTRP